MNLTDIWSGPGIASAAASILFIVTVLQVIDLPIVGALPKGTKVYGYAVVAVALLFVGLAGLATHAQPGIENVTAAAFTFFDIVGLALGVRSVGDAAGVTSAAASPG
jgi:chromate transport protein ChrA